MHENRLGLGDGPVLAGKLSKRASLDCMSHMESLLLTGKAMRSDCETRKSSFLILSIGGW